jgi:hypothetical protein
MTEEEKWRAEFEELGPAEVRRLINVFYWREGQHNRPQQDFPAAGPRAALARREMTMTEFHRRCERHILDRPFGNCPFGAPLLKSGALPADGLGLLLFRGQHLIVHLVHKVLERKATVKAPVR